MGGQDAGEVYTHPKSGCDGSSGGGRLVTPRIYLGGDTESADRGTTGQIAKLGDDPLVAVGSAAELSNLVPYPRATPGPLRHSNPLRGPVRRRASVPVGALAVRMGPLHAASRCPWESVSSGRFRVHRSRWVEGTRLLMEYPAGAGPPPSGSSQPWVWGLCLPPGRASWGEV